MEIVRLYFAFQGLISIASLFLLLSIYDNIR